MLTKLIKAERVTYGDYHFRLTVKHRYWIFPYYTRTYDANPSELPGLFNWYRHPSGSWISDKWLLEDLDTLLNRALYAKRVHPIDVAAQCE